MDDYMCIENSFFVTCSKRTSLMRILRKSKDDVNSRDKNGYTVLHSIAKLGNVSYTKALLSIGADVNAISFNGFTPLHLACMGEHEDCIDAILNYGPTMNVHHSRFSTPLHMFILSGMQNEQLLKKILSKGADPNSQDVDGNTALHLLTFRKSKEKIKEFVQLLIKYDANLHAINEEGCTPLHTAVNANFGKLVDVLLNEGADINMEDNEGYTPIMKVFSNTHRYENVVINLGNHLIMQHVLKFQVDLDLFNHIINHEAFMNFKIRCEDELLKLRRKKFHNSTISYYDILIASPHKIAKCLGNNDILQALIIFDENKYIFGNWIIRNFEKGWRRHKAAEKFRGIFSEVFPSLPVMCICRIMDYLESEHMKKFDAS